MKHHFINFIKNNFSNKSDAYLFILWSVFKNISQPQKLSEAIKNELLQLNYSEFKFNEKREVSTRIVEKIRNINSTGLSSNFSKLDSIQIKNFKAFGALSKEDQGIHIVLDQKKNIFFAPNGGGKTSLCEAFEYKLTGTIKEAVRRGVQLKEYIRRNDEKEEIQIKLFDQTILPDKVSGDFGQYFHKCFIEKNRLHEFALLGSKDTGTKEKDVIAVILGLQDLDDLISSFVQTSSFKLSGLKRNKISLEFEGLEKSHLTFLTQNRLLKEQIGSEKAKILHLLSNVTKEEITIETIESEINIIMDKIVVLEKEIINLGGKVYVVTPEKLINVENLIKRCLLKYNSLIIEFNQKIAKVNFEKFYKSLLVLKDSNAELDSCPACGTSILEVRTHPYEKAQIELDLLKDVSIIQSRMNRAVKHLKICFKLCIDFIKEYQENYKILHPGEFDFEIQLSQLRQCLKSNMETKEYNFLVESMALLEEKRIDLLAYLNLISEHQKLNNSDEAVTEINKSIEPLKENLDVLKVAKTNITNNEATLRKINGENSGYSAKVTELNSKLLLEKTHNEFINEVEIEYKNFTKDLMAYKLNIESQQLNNIEQKVTSYYQEINKNDDDNEYITDVNFVLDGSSYKILITFKDETKRNSYTCLSEGHLRSLGLSILLAIAEKNNVPFIIFDDVVNAIDSDHRANIIEMLFSNEFLKRTQQIITTHDRLFWERFCNTYSEKVNKKEVDKMSYVMSNTNKGTVLVQYNVGFHEKIQNALDCFDIRQALIYCRIWFESLVTQYCFENNESLTGKFHKEKNNLLKPTLESIYAVFASKFPGNTNLTLIKKDLINWVAQNQEHHSFNENSYNFVHSKSSDEIRKILNAVYELSIQLFPTKEKLRLASRRENLITLYDSYIRRFEDDAFKSKAPQEVQDRLKLMMVRNREELVSIDKMIELVSDSA